LPEVSSVSYVSSDEALVNFRTRHANDYLVLQALGELSENPLGAYLNIKAKDPSQYETISNFIEGDNGLSKDNQNIIDKVNYYQNKTIIDRLTSIVNNAQKMGFLVTLIFVIISIFIIFNTTKLAIFNSREEIGIMRLVGAGKKYIRGPFFVEGILYGLISSGITMIIFWPIS